MTPSVDPSSGRLIIFSAPAASPSLDDEKKIPELGHFGYRPCVQHGSQDEEFALINQISKQVLLEEEKEEVLYDKERSYGEPQSLDDFKKQMRNWKVLRQEKAKKLQDTKTEVIARMGDHSYVRNNYPSLVDEFSKLSIASRFRFFEEERRIKTLLRKKLQLNELPNFKAKHITIFLTWLNARELIEKELRGYPSIVLQMNNLLQNIDQQNPIKEEDVELLQKNEEFLYSLKGSKTFLQEFWKKIDKLERGPSKSPFAAAMRVQIRDLLVIVNVYTRTVIAYRKAFAPFLGPT